MIQTSKELRAEFPKLRDEVYKCAVEHGWWEEERNFGELLCLVHSEITEAWEHVCKGRGVRNIYQENGKQEGVVIDLADVVIRVLDIAGHYKHQIGITIGGSYHISGVNFAADLMHLHHSVSLILEFSRSYEKDSRAIGDGLDWLLDHTIQLADEWELDLYNAVKNKIAYNWSRPYKHGKKF